MLSITTVSLTSLALLNLKPISVHADSTGIPKALLEQNIDSKELSHDPLLDGKQVSNGYSDGGYTYLNPTDTSTERVSSYHLDTQEGWSNDLQTIIYDSQNKEWDIYYLHTEKVLNGNAGAKQNWERVTTKDFIHFSKPNIAIKDLAGDIGEAWSSAWTGSIVVNQGNIAGVPKGAKVAYFSGLSNKDNKQNIWAAWSNDNGKTFSNPLNNKNIILDHFWPWTSINREDERDADVFYWKNKLIMYTAEGDNLGVYKSDDGISWTNANKTQSDSKVSSSVFFNGLPFEAPVECPALRSMKTVNGTVKQVLFFGAKAPQARQTTGTYYVVGHLDDNGLFVAETEAKRLDQGTDYYGANFSGSDNLEKVDDSLITMGWIGNWNYTNSGIKANQDGLLPNSTRIGTYTLARKIVLNNDLSISSTPITAGLETDSVKKTDGVVSEQSTGKNNYYHLLNLTKQPVNSKYVLHFSTKNDTNYRGAIRIEFVQGKDSNLIIFDPASGKYRIDGQSSELTGAAADYYKNGLESGLGYINDSGLKNVKDFTITVYTDKNALELFFSNGQTATMSRFCVNNVQDLKVDGEDADKVNQFDIKYNQVGTKLTGYDEKQTEFHTDNSNSDSTMTGSTSVAKPSDSNKPNVSNKLPKAKTVMHKAIIYTSAGKKTVQTISQGTTVKIYGTRQIKGKKYYLLGSNQYILLGNVLGKTRKLKRNSFVYNKKANRIKRLFLRKKTIVKTYGSPVKIHGKKYYIIAKNQYVKLVNF